MQRFLDRLVKNDLRAIRDDRVLYSATMLWKGTYTMTYIARATTPGTFVRPPAHAEEMYNPAVNGRTGGGAVCRGRPVLSRRGDPAHLRG